MPSLGGISPMIRGNPNVVAVIVYDDENQGLKDLTTVMETLFQDKHLITRRQERLDKDQKILRLLTNRRSYEGVDLNGDHWSLIGNTIDEGIETMKKAVKKDVASLQAARKLYEFGYAIKHPEEIEHDLRDSREKQNPVRKPPSAPDGEEFTHIRFTPYRSNYPPLLPERAQRERLKPETIHKLEQHTKATVEVEKTYGETYRQKHKKTHTI